MDCPSCGALCAAGARFCWSCGQALRAPTEERRVVTVLFADLVGFTALSEHLDPEQVKRLVDHAFERLVRDVTAFGGRVDKIVGDAIVALFGAPVAHEDDAERAVRAAMRMQDTLAQHTAELARQTAELGRTAAVGGAAGDGAGVAGPGDGAGVGIRMRIGVNTGEVLVGALRAGGDYTAMGDVVNTASRLQTLAAPGEVLVGDSTRTVTQEVISYESRGALVVRGREQPIDVWSAVGALRPPGYRPRRRTTPLVGRDREVDTLANALRVSVTHGRGQVVLLLGEAGVGKTRLANELAELAGSELGVTHLTGRCVPYGEANPWWPVAEALRSGCGIRRDDPLDVARSRAAEAVASVLPPEDGHGPARTEGVVNGLLHLMGYEGPLRELDGARARVEATQALLAFLEAGVRRHPIMVRLADMHWADQAVLDLVDEVTTHLARHPFVFVATARGALLERWSPRAGRFNTVVMNLDPLERDAAGVLLDTLVGGELDEVTRSTLLDRSGGNPFYLEELATLIGPDGLGSDGHGRSTEVPDTLRGLVAARIDGLDPEEQQVLEDASVWGSSGRIEALNRIAAAMRDVTDVAGTVASMADKDVLVFDGAEWSFRSDLVREVAYGRLTKRERMARHLGIARFLEQKADERSADDGTVDIIARHFVVAARLGRDLGLADDLVPGAVRWAVEAARRAEADAAWLLARRLYTRALDLIDGDLPEERFACLVGRSRARAESWDEVGARRDATEALEISTRLGGTTTRARALLAMATAAARSGEVDVAEDELTEAISLFDAAGDVGGRAEALRQRGMAALLRGDTVAAEEPIAGALVAFRSAGDRHGEAWSLQNLAWIALSDGRLEQADAYTTESEAAFRDLGDAGGLAWAQGLMAFVRLQQGDLDTAAAIADRILVECERRGDRFGEGMMLTVRAHAELWTGRSVTAAATAGRAVTAFRTSSDLSGTVGSEQALAVAGRAEIMSGSTGKGRHLLSEAIRSGRDGNSDGAFAAAVGMVTAVQTGHPDQLLDVPVAQWIDAAGTERTGQQQAVYALALAQAGRIDKALPLARASLASQPDHGYVVACVALVMATAGHLDEVRAAAADVAELATATYLDRVWVDVALAMADLGPQGDIALDRAAAELGPGEDLVAVAMVDLARAVRRSRSDGRLEEPPTAAGRAGRSDVSALGPDHREIDRLLGDIGLSDTRWTDLLVRAARAAVGAEA